MQSRHRPLLQHLRRATGGGRALADGRGRGRLDDRGGWPDPEDGHEPGTVYLGWATPSACGHRLLRLRGSPAEVLDDTVAAALSLLTELAESTARETPIMAAESGRAVRR